MTDLFLKILNMSIAAGWMVLAVLLLRLLLKKAPRWSIVLLWGIVAVRLLCPFSIESVFSLIPSAQTVSPDIMLSPKPGISSGIHAINATINPVIGEVFAPTPTASVNPMQVWITVASVVWLAGIAAMALYAALSYWRLRRRIATAVRIEGNVFRSEHVASPFVFGLLRPRIYLPCDMEGEEQAYVVAHERSHICRKDHWWKPLGFALLSVYWFHPLMWLAYILLCRDIEVACDEKVIKEFGADQRADYSEALLTCSVKRTMIAACPLAFGEVGVKERVKKVLSYQKPAFWIILMAVIICVTVAVCFLTDPISQDDRQDPQTGKQPVSENVPGPAAFFYPLSMMTEEWQTGTFRLDAFPDVSFQWGQGKIEAVTTNNTDTLFETQKLYDLAASDLNLDGYPEICATAGTAAGEEYVVVYDYITKETYELRGDPSQCAYYLYTRDGYLMCALHSAAGETEQSGRLLLVDTDGEMKLAISAPRVPQQPDGNAVIWYDKNDPDSPDSGQMKLDAFPGVTFRWNHSPNAIDAAERLVAVKWGKETELFPGGATMSVFASDITGDGKPDFIANVYYFFSGLPSYNAVFVYDYAKDVYYSLADDKNTNHATKVSYYVRLEDGNLVCDKIHEATGQTLVTGFLELGAGENGRQLLLEAKTTYDTPVEYIFTGEHILQDRVTLVVRADGACNILFNPRLNQDGTSNRAQGTCTESDGKLILLTEDGRTYTFRFQGDDLVFLAGESNPLPDNCPMYDGAVLEANPYFT